MTVFILLKAGQLLVAYRTINKSIRSLLLFRVRNFYLFPRILVRNVVNFRCSVFHGHVNFCGHPHRLKLLKFWRYPK